MAYQAGTAATITLLLTDLRTFALANGWTSDEWSPGAANQIFSLHKSPGTKKIFVHFQWDEAQDGGIIAGPYQSLGYTPGQPPWNHPNDSGMGAASFTKATFTQDRKISKMAGPHTYYFFENDLNPTYIHVVTKTGAGVYRHFGFGELEMFGNWTGGEYAYGHHLSTNSPYDPNYYQHFMGFDFGGETFQNRGGATVHIEGPTLDAGTVTFPDLPHANTRWGRCCGYQQLGNDRSGVAVQQLIGGSRTSPLTYHFARFNVTQFNAHKSLIPIGVWQKHTGTVPETWRLLGYQPDVCVVNMGSLEDASEYVIGTDTWKIFPWVRKQYTLANVEESWNAGWAYRKVTA